jgi:hypothetical protein
MSGTPPPAPALAECEKYVQAVEAGACPAGFCDSAEAREALVALICVAPWESSQEREKGQALVARLWWAGRGRRPSQGERPKIPNSEEALERWRAWRDKA